MWIPIALQLQRWETVKQLGPQSQAEPEAEQESANDESLKTQHTKTDQMRKARSLLVCFSSFFKKLILFLFRMEPRTLLLLDKLYC